MQLSVMTLEGEEVLELEPVADEQEAAVSSEVLDESAEGSSSEAAVDVEAARTSRQFELARVNGVPEVKTEWVRRCTGRPPFRVCVRVPVLYRRTSRYIATATISTGRITNDAVWSAVRQCVAGAVATAGIVGLLTAAASGGSAGIASATATFQAALRSCLTARGGQFVALATDIRVTLSTRKETGEWQRV